MAKEDGHTPNEWYAVRHEHTRPNSTKDCYRIEICGNPVKVNGRTVASEPICTLHAGFVHFEGNATLILAAPDLLAACELAVGQCEYPEVTAILEAAIAKARGT